MDPGSSWAHLNFLMSLHPTSRSRVKLAHTVTLSHLGVKSSLNPQVVSVARWLKWLSTWALAHVNKGHSIAREPEAPLAHLALPQLSQVLQTSQVSLEGGYF